MSKESGRVASPPGCEASPSAACGVFAESHPSRAGTRFEIVEAFAIESNRIEGIRQTTLKHVEAHLAFLDGPATIPALVAFVGKVQPNARFRNKVDVPGVRVGDHIAPPSGPQIEEGLRRILAMREPWAQHIAYETLHPFTDGNGRSGRALWLHRYWHEHSLDIWAPRRGFLHSFYYHTLSKVRRDSDGPRMAETNEDSSRGEAGPARAEGIAPQVIENPPPQIRREG